MKIVASRSHFQSSVHKKGPKNGVLPDNLPNFVVTPPIRFPQNPTQKVQFGPLSVIIVVLNSWSLQTCDKTSATVDEFVTNVTTLEIHQIFKENATS